MDTNITNVAVLFGGKSPEHEVSIITGVQVINSIDTNKYKAVPVYIAKNGKWYYSNRFADMEVFKNLEAIPYISQEVYLPADPNNSYLWGVARSFFGGQFKIKVDVFFPCFHGGTGENGAFQGLFDICEKPYVGSDVLGSALGMDKIICKDLLVKHGIPTAPYAYYSKETIENGLNQTISELEPKFNYPVFVKPANSGSSIGVTKAHNTTELKSGLEVAATFSSKVLVEESIEPAKEMNISVMGNNGKDLQISECEEVYHTSKFLSYDDKYKSGDGKSQGMASAKRQILKKLEPEVLKLIQETAKKVYICLGCAGLARVDFLIKENPLQAYVIEINTLPGSLAFYLWDAKGVSFRNLTTKLIELAQERFVSDNKNIHTFSSNILKDFKPGVKNSKSDQ
ncbi:D-alanine--D-alanine ligase [Patescibacteria group bacterium]|nr:D-alanine--D-alanine ligase [Patescibacteria group bacterium]